MNFPARPRIRLPILLVFFASSGFTLSQSVEARRAYSYADMYAPQTSEVEVAKPKKKPPRKPKPKLKPISVSTQKPVVKESAVEEPVSSLPKFDEPAKQEKPSKLKHETFPSKVSESRPEKKASADFEKAKHITLEELLGSDVTTGMSSQ